MIGIVAFESEARHGIVVWVI